MMGRSALLVVVCISMARCVEYVVEAYYAVFMLCMFVVLSMFDDNVYC